MCHFHHSPRLSLYSTVVVLKILQPNRQELWASYPTSLQITPYGVDPVEFILDAVLALGAYETIAVHDNVKQSLNGKQIAGLLRLLSTFDAADLDDRYSDRYVKEMVNDYDLHLESMMRICEEEGFHLCFGSGTRLSIIQEDGILDIMLKGASMDDPYPSSLEGLA